MRLPMCLAILAASFGWVAIAPAQPARNATSAATSAPISNIAYRVTFDSSDARRRVLHVDMTFNVDAGDAPVILALPAWTPGSYELDYFARAVLRFGAASAGRALSWDKVDYDTWRVRPAGSKSITVSFDYLADTLDNAMAWARSDFVMFNGTNVFLYPEGRSFDFPSTVTIRTEPAWRVITGMTPGPAPSTFTASSYHELVDMPFFVGRFDVDSVRAPNGWLRFAAYPSGSMPKPTLASTLAHLAKIIPVEGAVFGDVPFTTYTVMQIADSSYGGISGLEHANSHVDVTTPLAIGEPIEMSIYAHEIFHAWNVKRLRPSDLWPYQYAHEQPTPWLWMSEGITDYYADLSEVRAGVIDSAGFFELTAGKMAEVANSPPVALTDASLTTWIHPEDGTADIYYPKGSLAGLMLDIMIRDASDNHASLDDVMRSLYRECYQHGTGFTDAQWWAAVSAAAGGQSFADFNARYIDGRDPYPWKTLLPLAGLRATIDTVRTPTLGVSAENDSAGVRVARVAPGSSADEAGVQAGDYLLSVAGVPVTDPEFINRLREKVGLRTGTPVIFHLQRGDDTLDVTGKLQVQERVTVRVEADPAASPKAIRIRSGLLHVR
ncbi:MAG TPA: PDZ domain-containing protein [Gemmatimonadaceae bacterium]|nr:PDZ domain-containing protein [Gemmatimonadaceae bacterium]